MSQTERPRLRAMLTANGAYLALALSALAVDDSVRSAAVNAWPWLATLAVLLEGSTLFAVRFLYPTGKKSTPIDPFPEVTIEAFECRFATLVDAKVLDELYREWFSPDLSISDAEYVKILARGGHFRVIEHVFSNGSRDVVGFYSLWPLSRSTFSGLVNGTQKEKSITCDDVFSMQSRISDILYIPEICAKNNSNSGGHLLRDARSYVAKYLRAHPNVECIGTWGYTDIGKRLAVRFGMKQAKSQKGNLTEMYEVDRSNALTLLKSAEVFEAIRKRPL